jgi:hypothetical protein
MHEGTLRDPKRLRDVIARKIDAAMARELEMRKKDKEERAFALRLELPSH